MTAEDLVQEIIDLLSEGSWYVFGALIVVLFIALLDGMRRKSHPHDSSEKKPFSGKGGGHDGGSGPGSSSGGGTGSTP